MRKAIKKVAPACFGATVGAQGVRLWNHIGTINWLVYPLEFFFTFLITTLIVACLFYLWSLIRKK